LKLLGSDFDVEVIETGLEGSVFKYTSKHRNSVFRVPLPGRFQVFNTGVAIALAEEIKQGVSDAVLQAGLGSVRWPGRCELIPGEPPIILDGAINAESASYLRELLEQTARPLELIVGVPADKDWQGVIRTLAPMAKTVWLTTASNPHLVFPPEDVVLAEAKNYNPDCRLVPDMATALEYAISAAKNQGAIVVAGTQSLIRDAKMEIKSVLGRGSDD
jgi:dihydrofolate synthase/folylpolyglutamate synthase